MKKSLPAPNTLFVYGTLCSTGRHAMARTLREASKTWEPARMKGAILHDLGAYPGLRLSEDPEEIVHGELFTLHRPFHRILRILDHYEGVPQGLYTREIHLITPENSEDPRPAWVYIYQGSLPPRSHIADGRYRPDL